MAYLQESQFWIGFGFVVLLVLVFVYAFFKTKDLTPSQFVLLRILTSLCAAFAGGLITGSVLFSAEGTAGPGLKYTINSTAGFAFALIVWFFFGKLPAASPPPPGINIKVQEGVTFEDMVRSIVKTEDGFVEFEGFLAKELAARLKDWQLREKTTVDALRQLRKTASAADPIRPYDVTYADSTYHLKIRG